MQSASQNISQALSAIGAAVGAITQVPSTTSSTQNLRSDAGIASFLNDSNWTQRLTESGSPSFDQMRDFLYLHPEEGSTNSKALRTAILSGNQGEIERVLTHLNINPMHAGVLASFAPQPLAAQASATGNGNATQPATTPASLGAPPATQVSMPSLPLPLQEGTNRTMVWQGNRYTYYAGVGNQLYYQDAQNPNQLILLDLKGAREVNPGSYSIAPQSPTVSSPASQSQSQTVAPAPVSPVFSATGNTSSCSGPSCSNQITGFQSPPAITPASATSLPTLLRPTQSPCGAGGCNNFNISGIPVQSQQRSGQFVGGGAIRTQPQAVFQGLQRRNRNP